MERVICNQLLRFSISEWHVFFNLRISEYFFYIRIPSKTLFINIHIRFFILLFAIIFNKINKSNLKRFKLV